MMPLQLVNREYRSWGPYIVSYEWPALRFLAWGEPRLLDAILGWYFRIHISEGLDQPQQRILRDARGKVILSRDTDPTCAVPYQATNEVFDEIRLHAPGTAEVMERLELVMVELSVLHEGRN